MRCEDRCVFVCAFVREVTKLACCGDCEWMPGLSLRLICQHPIIDLLENKNSPFGGLGQGGGVIDIWPVKPFETVMVMKGYTNTIELN